MQVLFISLPFLSAGSGSEGFLDENTSRVIKREAPQEDDRPSEGLVKKVKIEVPDNDDVEMEGEENGDDQACSRSSRMLFHRSKGSMPELIGERSRVLACVRKVSQLYSIMCRMSHDYS